jgi:hypothetical protein
MPQNSALHGFCQMNGEINACKTQSALKASTAPRGENETGRWRPVQASGEERSPGHEFEAEKALETMDKLPPQAIGLEVVRASLSQSRLVDGLPSLTGAARRSTGWIAHNSVGNRDRTTWRGVGDLYTTFDICRTRQDGYHTKASYIGCSNRGRIAINDTLPNRDRSRL